MPWLKLLSHKAYTFFPTPHALRFFTTHKDAASKDGGATKNNRGRSTKGDKSAGTLGAAPTGESLWPKEPGRHIG